MNILIKLIKLILHLIWRSWKWLSTWIVYICRIDPADLARVESFDVLVDLLLHFLSKIVLLKTLLWIWTENPDFTWLLYSSSHFVITRRQIIHSCFYFILFYFVCYILQILWALPVYRAVLFFQFALEQYHRNELLLVKLNANGVKQLYVHNPVHFTYTLATWN